MITCANVTNTWGLLAKNGARIARAGTPVTTDDKEGVDKVCLRQLQEVAQARKSATMTIYLLTFSWSSAGRMSSEIS